MANTLVWVDIPVTDLDRAIRFYSAVLGAPVSKQDYPGMSIGLLPGGDEDVTGCLHRSDTDRQTTAHCCTLIVRDVWMMLLPRLHLPAGRSFWPSMPSVHMAFAR